MDQDHSGETGNLQNNSANVDTLLDNGIFIRFLGPGLESRGVPLYKLGKVFQSLEILLSETYHDRYPDKPPVNFSTDNVHLELLDRRKASDGYIVGQVIDVLNNQYVAGLLVTLMFESVKKIYSLVSQKIRSEALMNDPKLAGPYNEIVIRAIYDIAWLISEKHVEAVEISVRRPRPMSVRIDKDTFPILEKIWQDRLVDRSVMLTFDGRVLGIDMINHLLQIAAVKNEPHTIPQQYLVSVPNGDLAKILKAYSPGKIIGVKGYKIKRPGRRKAIEIEAAALVFKAWPWNKTIGLKWS